MILYKSSNTNHVPVLQHYPKYFWAQAINRR
jgi:hypothetical protein